MIEKGSSFRQNVNTNPRSATINDMPYIVRMIGEFDLDYEHLSFEQFLVIEEEGQVVAFGRLKPYPDAVELGSVGVRTDRRKMGYGKIMVEALIEKVPDEIWITTNLRDYFRKFGFTESEQMPVSIKNKLENFCHFTCRPNIAAMVLRKTAGSKDAKK
jgi:N-acetylglutamate synthase-like GNAT family acetyltransferase